MGIVVFWVQKDIGANRHLSQRKVLQKGLLQGQVTPLQTTAPLQTMRGTFWEVFKAGCKSARQCITSRIWKRGCLNPGQMAIELAVIMPVILALTIVCVDMGVFLGDCARFDRLVPQVVRVHACSPASNALASSAIDAAICKDLEEAMGSSDRIAVSVSSVGLITETARSDLLSFVPQPYKYSCTLTFYPWPFQRGGFGIQVSGFSHTARYVVDPYRPGVLG